MTTENLEVDNLTTVVIEREKRERDKNGLFAQIKGQSFYKWLLLYASSRNLRSKIRIMMIPNAEYTYKSWNGIDTYQKWSISMY